MSISKNAIAITGLACKFPGANNMDEFWNLLRLGKNAVSQFSQEELLQSSVDPRILNDPNYVKARGILGSFEDFDQNEFIFSDTEFALLNIVSRMSLQLVSQALVDANINPKSCPRETAVFTGVDYNELIGKINNDSSPISAMQEMKEFAYTKSLSSLIAYQFDLLGKTINLHTGCSTSLVATIQACEELLTQRANLAICGGVSLVYPERMGYLYEPGGTLSPNGVCRPFDEKANGAVLSNGAGIIILKRLEDAIKAGDRIYSIIEGKAMNNDGRMKTGFLVPSIQGQYACIKQAWEEADVKLEQMDYIEAHGSATPVGDPMEIFALKKTQNQEKYDRKWCGIGSVKSNIGHTTVASGMAALIKASLMMHHRAIVPTIHCDVLNKNIDLENTPFYIASEYKELPKDKESFYIGVSNFGFGGTNAHVVLRAL